VLVRLLVGAMTFLLARGRPDPGRTANEGV